MEQLTYIVCERKERKTYIWIVGLKGFIMFKKSIFGMAAVFAGMFLGYAYHFLMVRMLPTNTYGDLSLIIGILSIIMVPTGSLSIIITREVAKIADRQKRRHFMKEYSKKIIAVSVIASALFLAMSPLIGKIFGDSNIVIPLQIIAISIPASYITSAMKGYLRGKEKIGFLSAFMVVEPAIKLALTIALIYAGFGLTGASASLAITPFIILAFFILFFRNKFKSSVPEIAHKIGSNKPLILILATNIVLAVFLSLDLFAVKYYLGSVETGFYNVANITAKVLMYAVGGITLVFLPKAAKLNMKDNRQEIGNMIKKSVLLMLPAFIAFMAVPDRILSIFYTEKYLSALPAFRILSIGMFAYGLFSILLNLSWSQNDEKSPLIISLIILFADAILLAYLVPLYGLAGASLATTASSVALLVMLALKLPGRYL